jgi:hypothetical protein
MEGSCTSDPIICTVRGDACLDGECVCTETAAMTQTACGDDPDCCRCLLDVNGRLACAAYSTACTSADCDDFQTCPGGTECPPDHACIAQLCSGLYRNLCFPLCGTTFVPVV